MGERHAVISEENRGPILNLATWISLCAAITAAAIKVYTKRTMRSALDLNDLFIFMAVVSSRLKLFLCTLREEQLASVAQCVAANAQVHYGLGQHEQALVPGGMNNIYIVSVGP